MWDLPGVGFEPVSPALAGRFSTTAPPGKSKGMDLVSGFSYSELLICSILTILFIQGQPIILINIKQYPFGMANKSKTINTKPGGLKYLELFFFFKAKFPYDSSS